MDCTYIFTWLDRQDWEVVAGVSSAIIALCALFYTMLAGWYTHKHNKLSVKPHLTTWVTRNPQQRYYSLGLVNNGLGPALITSVEITLDNQVIKGEGTEPIENIIRALFVDTQYTCDTSFFESGYSMPADERRTLVSLQFLEPFTITPEIFEERMKRCGLYIRYRSFYNDKFSYSSDIEKII